MKKVISSPLAPAAVGPYSLQNMSDFGTLNEVYSQYFKEPYPARVAFQVAALPKGALAEAEVIAVK